ncbi:CoA-binding protein [Bdellovibrio svalbardensis]|uniref:CoA-binding protein n=1 Tax=Bdellovibrio svalbardensis TaxID=2972972 RepID=A0ABT6DN99_9BACT|nr:CoA-binding protein [Bdellovibrio svalbardensis]MDG0817580.1 CoA-binding protein [Bdellovibrio svalbardensis]
MKEKVAILGASNKPDRYAYKALKMLQEYGHTPLPVNPAFDEIEGVKVAKSLDELSDIDTVTLYMNPHRLEEQVDRLIRLKPKRVIFNPGTESKEIEQKLKAAGIQTTEACTLVLLRTNQFEE